mmetsp:Transcript_14509/g.45619  ORF Transcript_14509/g.45619 Transcript_14509/m.45619 type:complete len:200 (+) Transcript_14509:1285-1884(+)
MAEDPWQAGVPMATRRPRLLFQREDDFDLQDRLASRCRAAAADVLQSNLSLFRWLACPAAARCSLAAARRRVNGQVFQNVCQPDHTVGAAAQHLGDAEAQWPDVHLRAWLEPPGERELWFSGLRSHWGTRGNGNPFGRGRPQWCRSSIHGRPRGRTRGRGRRDVDMGRAQGGAHGQAWRRRATAALQGGPRRGHRRHAG